MNNFKTAQLVNIYVITVFVFLIKFSVMVILNTERKIQTDTFFTIFFLFHFSTEKQFLRPHLDHA